MGEGGPPHRWLEQVRNRYPLALHGVGLSIGGSRPLDRAHIGRLRSLIDRYSPHLFSEHLAWSSHKGVFFNDPLPLPYTPATLRRVVEHIHQVQEVLRRRILLENPSSYLSFEESTHSETDFIREVQKRTGCGLLLDVNNVVVASSNLAVIELAGPIATLIEWDTNIPSWNALQAEALRAEFIMRTVDQPRRVSLR